MRYITLTKELKDKALLDFQAMLNQGRFRDEKINYTFDLNQVSDNTDKIIINVKAEAWLKMWSLVATENGEIGWHGTVERKADKIFEITDILVYPQYVTGVTVQTDDVGYGDWLHKDLSDDEINSLRFHGHSHVNMSTTPSGVDTNWYDQILQGLMNDDFYIFAILNKREDYWIELYDLKTNTVYEKGDIIINVLMEDGNYLNNWVVRNKELSLKTRPVTRTINNKTASKELDEGDFINLLLDLSEVDKHDKITISYVVTELQKRAYKNQYFGLGYMDWLGASDMEKVYAAQSYYDELMNYTDFSPKVKQIKYNKAKKRGGLYD